jgi:hypothetical protein
MMAQQSGRGHGRRSREPDASRHRRDGGDIDAVSRSRLIIGQAGAVIWTVTVPARTDAA